jgi:glycosyltransferase involved in cell wall biosynthesis
MKISVIIPAYNEVVTIEEIIKRVQATHLIDEIVVVDDGSTDGTREILARLDKENQVKFVPHPKNLGKGTAVRTGIQNCSGEIVIIQDADLEYDPREYPNLLRPLEEGIADVVYGSRFLGGARRPILFWNMVANRILTFITNILYNNILSDMETGYKVFLAEVFKRVTIKSNRFDFEPEITAKVLKQHVRLYELPISYSGRDYAEGKKITWRDGFAAIWALVKFRFVD